MNATETLTTIREDVERIKSDEPQRFPDAASPGDCFRQGDIYIEKLSSAPEGCRISDKPESQLAPGTTKGSRHILDSLDGVTMYVRPSPTALDGPVFETTQERTVTHPEHGDCILPPGVYGITYQRQHAKELRRVMD